MKELIAKQGDKFEAITKYVNTDTLITLRCKECGSLITNKPYKFLQGQGCKKCKGIRITCSDDYYKLAKEKWDNKFGYANDYVDEKTNITVICPKHGKIMMNPMAHLVSPCGCSECSKIEAGLKRRRNLDDLINQFKSKYGDIYDYSKYIYEGEQIPSTVICKKCGHEFQIDFNHHLRGQGCPYCNMSHLENEIANVLEQNSVNFIEHCNKELPFLRRKHVDFYLPDYNIAIECQGRQHFMADDFYGGIEAAFRIMQRDRIKYNQLIENNVDIIYYTTVNFDADKVPFYKNKKVFKNKEFLLKYIIENGKTSNKKEDICKTVN